MKKVKLTIHHIPSILWGEHSDKVYLFVHGNMSDKESAETFASLAIEKGYQVLSFDLLGAGERQATDSKCDIPQAKHDLKLIYEYAVSHFSKLSLFACSLGAYFSLHAYSEVRFENCLFQSPILDMPYLVGKMFEWFDITPQQLEQEKEIPTPIDTLSWEYYNYILSHPITSWLSPTSILYGGSDHPFTGEENSKILYDWLKNTI